jgi:hypothetical protein
VASAKASVSFRRRREGGEYGLELNERLVKKVDKLLRTFQGPKPTRTAYLEWLLDREIADLEVLARPPKPEATE